MKKALIALVPVIHANYLHLFKKYPDTLYILGESVLEEWECYKNLIRDLRRMDQDGMAQMIRGAGLVGSVKVLEKANIAELHEFESFVMPDEDVSHWFAETFLKGKKIEFEPIFLRWDKPMSTQELEVPPDRTVTTNSFHKEMMEGATKLSQKSANWWRQIGTLAVQDGKIIAVGFNKHVPTQQNIEVYGDLRLCFDFGECHELSNSIHGEASLVAYAAKKGISLSGADLYVTTFPCPTCAKLIAEAGIKRVFYKDGYSLSDAEDVLKNADIEIILVQ